MVYAETKQSNMYSDYNLRTTLETGLESWFNTKGAYTLLDHYFYRIANIILTEKETENARRLNPYATEFVPFEGRAKINHCNDKNERAAKEEQERTRTKHKATTTSKWHKV